MVEPKLFGLTKCHVVGCLVDQLKKGGLLAAILQLLALHLWQNIFVAPWEDNADTSRRNTRRNSRTNSRHASLNLPFQIRMVRLEVHSVSTLHSSNKQLPKLALVGRNLSTIRLQLPELSPMGLFSTSDVALSTSSAGFPACGLFECWLGRFYLSFGGLDLIGTRCITHRHLCSNLRRESWRCFLDLSF